MTLKITTHYMAPVTERRNMDRGLCEKGVHEKNLASYREKRNWDNSIAGNESRRPKFSFCGPDWLHPRKLAEMMATRTSTIWGYAGRMADVEL